MAMSRIEQLIEDIYEYVESCKMQPFSTTKVVVPKDELYDLLDELRLRTPDEIKRYQKIIANRDAILTDAEEKGKAIVEDADNRALSMINEHEIMQKAYDQANAMVNRASAEADRVLTEANYEANQIRTSSLAYTEELLNSVESIVSSTYNNANRDYQALTGDLKSALDLINANKEELSIPSDSENSYDESDNNNDVNGSNDDYEEDSDLEDNYEDNNLEDSYDDYNFDEDTFIKDID